MPASLNKFMCGADGLDVDLNEIYRYMGVKGEGADSETEQLALNALKEVIAGSKPCAVYTLSDIKRDVQNNSLDLGFGSFCSRDVSKYLSSCEKAVIFAATIGIHTDRLVSRYEYISPVKALAVNSAGTALIEAFCDYLCLFLKREYNDAGLKSVSRFSAGYGDFPLECQRGLLEMLRADKILGISLDDSLLMTPAKSVTAVVGLKK